VADEAALIEALRNGTIAGAGLDVFEQEPVAPDHPLLSMDQVLLAPTRCAGPTNASTRSRAKAWSARGLRRRAHAALGGATVDAGDLPCDQP
jgi:phosphoglycerate dehydrogenase-like enzyme